MHFALRKAAIFLDLIMTKVAHPSIVHTIIYHNTISQLLDYNHNYFPLHKLQLKALLRFCERPYRTLIQFSKTGLNTSRLPVRMPDRLLDFRLFSGLEVIGKEVGVSTHFVGEGENPP